MVYILRAGPPLEVSQLDSTMPSFSICRSVRYNVPGFIASNPKAEVRSMSSYPYEFHSLKESRITGTSQFRGRASTPRNPRSRPSTLCSCPSSLFMYLSSILYMQFTYMYWSVKDENESYVALTTRTYYDRAPWPGLHISACVALLPGAASKWARLAPKL